MANGDNHKKPMITIGIVLTWSSSNSTRWGCAWSWTSLASRMPGIRLVCTARSSVPACET